MVTKRFVGSDPAQVREEIEQSCGTHLQVVSFHFSKPRGIRRLFFGPRVEVVVLVEESTDALHPPTASGAPTMHS